MRRESRAAVAVVLAWATAVAVNRSLTRVRGRSMAPTLDPGDVVLTTPLGGGLRRGDVVLLRDPRDRVRRQVKRVVGFGGESLRVTDGRLDVDGRPLDEAYAVGSGPDGGLAVPPGHVVVLGDARDSSTDSRVYGAVPTPLVDARVLARVWPRPRLLRERPRPGSGPGPGRGHPSSRLPGSGPATA